MKILIVIPNISSFIMFFTELSQRLTNEGLDIFCACSTNHLWGRKDLPPGLKITVVDIPLSRGGNLVGHVKSTLALSKLVKEIEPTIIHSHFSTSILTTALAKRNNWPVTLGTFHGLHYPELLGARRQLIKKVEVWSASRLDKVWVLNHRDFRELNAARQKIDVNKHSSYGVGCDLKKFNPSSKSETDRIKLRNRLGFQPDDQIFAFIGRFVRFKGFDVTIRAFLRLAKEYPNVRFLLIGSRDPLHTTGLSEDEEDQLMRSTFIRDVGWQNNVEDYLSISKAMILPSNREGLPVSIMEALAMGVPVITSSSAGCVDIVRNGIDGLVLKDVNIDGLVNAMELMLCNDQYYLDMSRNAFDGRARFDRKIYIEEQFKIYQEFGQ